MRRGHNARIRRTTDRPVRGSAGTGRVVVAAVVAVLATAAAVIGVLLARGEEGTEPPPPALTLPSEIVGPDPLSFDDDRASAYERAAAFGLSHALFAKSPGGVVASARRTAAFRPSIDDAASGSDLDPDMLEAIVFLESAGRPDVIAGDDVENAAGLTQILAETATNFLGMDVDLEASRRLTRRLDAARKAGNQRTANRLRAERRGVDARFDPAQALAGTVRYLAEARRRFGRDDLAVVSYHMGIGNLEGVVRAYARAPDEPLEDVVREHDVSYARLYFDSSPARHRDAWRRLASLGDDSQTYYWRVLAAREIMRLYRADPSRLGRLARLHGHGPSAEWVLHPPESTRRFAEPSELEDALRSGALRPLSSRDGLPYEIGPQVGRRASELGAGPELYRSLRPRALSLLGYLSGRVRAISGAERPLRVTSAAFDEAYAALLLGRPAGLRTQASMHATGNSFDVRRRYASGAQAEAFQYVLERLEALGLIAWARDPRAIHVTVSPRAAVRGSPS